MREVVMGAEVMAGGRRPCPARGGGGGIISSPAVITRGEGERPAMAAVRSTLGTGDRRQRHGAALLFVKVRPQQAGGQAGARSHAWVTNPPYHKWPRPAAPWTRGANTLLHHALPPLHPNAGPGMRDWKSTIGPSLLGRGCFAMGKVSSCMVTSHQLSSRIRAVWQESELGHPAAIGSYPSSPPVKGLQKAPLPFPCRSIDWTRVMESAWTIRCSALIDHSNVIYFLFFLLGNI